MNSNKGQELANLLISKLKLVDLDSKLAHDKWSPRSIWLSKLPGEFNDIVMQAFDKFQGCNKYTTILLWNWDMQFFNFWLQLNSLNDSFYNSQN